METPDSFDAIARARCWVEEAIRTAPHLGPAGATPIEVATAMSLATADADGNPSVRYVLLKQVDARGFVFYTNYESRKGLELEVRVRAAVAIWWPWLGRQLRAEGAVRRLPDAESDAYFATRPRLSQVSAWASRQSRELADPSDLDARIREVEARFRETVPRPPHWGGYRLDPQRIEFWTAREGRLHDRVLAERDDAGWRARRLYP